MDQPEESNSPVKICRPSRSFVIQSFKCLICGKQGKKEEMAEPKEQSISTFTNALILRKECNGYTLDEFSEFVDIKTKQWKIDISLIRWHRNCYKSYVSKQNIQFGRTVDNNTAKSSNEDQTSTRSRNELPDLKTSCFFCGFQKRNKDKKLCLIQFDETLKKLEKQCNLKNDSELRRKIGGDFSKLPAYDAKYHSTCYKAYMRSPEEKVEQSESPHDAAFNALVEYIDPVLASGKAMTLTNLLVKYKRYLQDQGYENWDSYTTQKLKGRIQKHYGNTVSFTNENHKTHTLYSSDISVTDAINSASIYKELMKNKTIMETPELSNSRLFQRAAEIIKGDIEQIDGISIHPLNPDAVNFDKVKETVPSSLITLLDYICGRDIKNYSVAQDIVSIATNGKKRMPKNVGLAISLKNSLASKEFITYCNKLGHSISYDDVNRIETTWATSILSTNDGYATLPPITTMGLFTQAASDNADYGQENNSQHVTNTILYQYGKMNCDNLRWERPKHIRRSISVQNVPLENFRFADDPILPKSYKEINILDIFNDTRHQCLRESTSINDAWLLLRITGNKIFKITNVQAVPTWTGFRKIISVKISTPTIIRNCRSLPAPPTDINVVYNMLLNVEQMLTKLGQPDPCVTVDEAVYQLAKKVQWNVPRLQNITVRMGGFHRAKNFTSVIGKRMRSSGFEEILSSADLFGQTQIEGN